MSRITMTFAALLLLVTAIAPAAFAAEPDIPALIAAAPAADDFPTADEITLWERIEITVDEDGRMTRRVHQVRKIFTNWAMRRTTDPRVGWNDTRQELDVAVCRTYQAGGAIVESPANALNEVTPDAVGHAAAFMDLREMVISHVGLEPGCVIELDYTVRDLEPGMLPPSGQIFLQGRWPVLERTAALSGPGLHWEVLNGEADATETDAGVTVTVRDLAGIPDEGNGANRGDYLPSLVYSFGLTQGWTELAERMIAAGNDARGADEAMLAWLKETGDEPALTPLDTVQRIAALIGDGTRTVHLPAGPWSRAPRPAAAIFAGGPATAWEECLLAASLLEAADLEAEIFAVSRYRTWAKSVPAANIFSDIVVKTRVDGANWWLSPTRDEAWPGSCDHPDRLMLRLNDSVPGGVQEYRWPTDSATGSCVLNVDLRPGDDGGLLAAIDYRAAGLLRGGEMDAEKLASALAGAALPGAEVTGTEVLQIGHGDVHLRVEAKAEELGEAIEDILVFVLPHAPHGATDALPGSCRIQEPVRATPLFLPGAMTETVSVRLTLPEGMAFDFLPVERDLAGSGCEYSLTHSVDGNVLALESRLALPAGRVEPADWPALRELLAAVQAANAGQVVITR